MGKITYELSDFNKTKAKNGALVVGIKSGYIKDPKYPTIDNIELVNNKTWQKNGNFLGAGVIKIREGHYILIVDSVEYIFDTLGNGVEKEEDSTTPKYVLKMGKVTSDVMLSGNTVTSSITSATTRGYGGDDTTYTNESSEVTIDSLNPRDHFAIQILREILSHTPEDPSSMSTALMATYCDAAYQWANFMLTSAAGARTTLTDDTATSATTRAEVGALETNTEKLLNNIVSALEKTDIESDTVLTPAYWYKKGQEIVEGEHTNEVAQTLPDDEGGYPYKTTTDAEGDHWKWYPAVMACAERISNPEMNALWKEYVTHTEQPAEGSEDEPVTTKYGLYDLIQAIKNIDAGGGGGTTEVDFTSLNNTLQGLSTNRAITELPNINIGNTGLGRDANNPIYISGGGGFPSRQVLAAAFTEAVIHDFLTFNEAGAVGYSTKAEAAKAVWSQIATEDIWSKIYTTVDARIKDWLQAATVTINGTTYNLNVNTPT